MLALAPVAGVIQSDVFGRCLNSGFKIHSKSWRDAKRNPFLLILSPVEGSKHVVERWVMHKELRLRQYLCGSALRQAQGERFFSYFKLQFESHSQWFRK